MGAGFSEGLGDGVDVAQYGVALVFGKVGHLFGEGADVAVFYLRLRGAEQFGDFFVTHAHEGSSGIYVEPVGDFYDVLGVEGLGEATQEVVQGGIVYADFEGGGADAAAALFGANQGAQVGHCY